MADSEQIKPTSREIASDLVKTAKQEVRKAEEKRLARRARGFADFIREQGVVGLAIGLAIGTSATVLVKSIVDNVITPLVGAILPGSSAGLAEKYVCLSRQTGELCTNKLSYGVVVSNLISFIAVAGLIYFVVKGLKLDRLDKKKEQK